jgi:hypothetical protein
MRCFSAGPGFICFCEFIIAQLSHRALRALFQFRSCCSPVTVLSVRKRLLTLRRASVTMFAP